MLFAGMPITSATDPDGSGYSFISKTNIQTNGSFLFSAIPPPPDSLFIRSISNNDTNFHNSGLLSDSAYPFMHDYASIQNLVTNNADSLLGYAYFSNDNDTVGYSCFIRPSSPIGTYSVIYEYVDKSISVNKIKSAQQDGYEITWTYTLNLQKGWNTVYIKKSSQSSTQMGISISQEIPTLPARWIYTSYFSAPIQQPSTSKGKTDLTGRCIK